MDLSNLEKNKTIIKKIAMLGDEPLFWKTCAKIFFKVILNNYEWNSNGIKYKFILETISDQDILNDKLSVSNYDVLIIPGGGVGDGHSITKGFNFSFKVRNWKKKIQRFVKDGGGIVGFCGGAALITPLSTGKSRKPTTFVERLYNKSSIDITSTYSYYKYLALPIYYPFQKTHPERIGTMAYVFSFKPTETEDGRNFHTGGIPIDIKINKNNPIFSDFPDDNLTIRWWGGQALLVPEKPDREIKICAKYPEKELHENEKTRIHAWRYVGGFKGFFKGFFKAMSYVKKEKIRIFDAAMFTYYLASKWKKTNKLILSDIANRPCIVTEVYPNENKGRILLCTLHPEFMVWWDGVIEERKDEQDICIANGLYQWKNITTIKNPLDENITYTWWVVRRFVAWATKIPEKEFPPIKIHKLNPEEMEQLSRNILWDGSLKNQMENI
ncbi:hypothetical protein AYK24_09900 [Thermoplasmatales archaeon SG8-52-4]|nr:MAG: hypothetical protein AYK24_09900 [Thermoplasmatales archaeon SG8-52-4]